MGATSSPLRGTDPAPRRAVLGFWQRDCVSPFGVGVMAAMTASLFQVLYEALTLRHGAHVYCTIADLRPLFRVGLRLRRRARRRARDRVRPFFHGHYRLPE